MIILSLTYFTLISLGMAIGLSVQVVGDLIGRVIG